MALAVLTDERFESQKTGPNLAWAERFRYDERWQLIERIRLSKEFSKSTRSMDFLLYVCREFLTGRSDRLNEQDIGERVFQRDEGFDPGLDNIVRVTARRVRQKLEKYYAGEGQSESLVLSIPVGGYVPRFDAREMLLLAEPDEPVVHPDVPPTSVVSPAPAIVFQRKSRGLSWLVICAGIFAALAVGIALGKLRRGVAIERQATHQMWSSLLDSSRRSIFVPGDSSLVLLENRTHHSVPLDDYVSKRYLQQIPQDSSNSLDRAREEATRSYNSVVDVRFAGRLARLPEAEKSVDIVVPRDLRVEDLKESDVILSGAREANPWVQMFQDQLNYWIVDRQQGDNYTVVNRHPLSDEPSVFEYKSNDPSNLAYAFVAYLPNLSGRGRVLLLQGTTMAGTEAAMDFVLDPEGLSQFLVQHGHRHDAPYFEVLLKTRNINGSAPKSEVLSFRIH